MTTHCNGLGQVLQYKHGGPNLAVWVKISPLSEMVRSCMCFHHVAKMSTLTYNCISNVFLKMIFSLTDLLFIGLFSSCKKLTYCLLDRHAATHQSMYLWKRHLYASAPGFTFGL